MSLWDCCIPDPPLECPRCDGILAGWETRNEGSCFLVWQQGVAAPIEQKLDPDVATPLERRAEFRLPFEFTLSWGECSKCGYKFWGDVRGTSDGAGVWRTLQLDPPPLFGAIIESDWLQCPECCDAFPLRPPKHLYICPSCQRLVRYTSKDNDRGT